jgi:hypothetical protein
MYLSGQRRYIEKEGAYFCSHPKTSVTASVPTQNKDILLWQGT